MFHLFNISFLKMKYNLIISWVNIIITKQWLIYANLGLNLWLIKGRFLNFYNLFKINIKFINYFFLILINHLLIFFYFLLKFIDFYLSIKFKLSILYIYKNMHLSWCFVYVKNLTNFLLTILAISFKRFFTLHLFSILFIYKFIYFCKLNYNSTKHL